MEKIALITGASKGIGKELAFVFAKNGYSLLLIARNSVELQQLQIDLKNQFQCVSKILSVDLAKPESVEVIMNTFKDEMKNVEILINNAGLGYAKKFTDLSMDETVTMVDVNISALTKLMHSVLPYMVMAKRGKILNIASTAAFLPGPYLAVYYASKAYVKSLSEALCEEYKEYGISVSVLCPGATKTDFHRRGGMMNAWLIKGPMMSAEKVATIAYRGVMKNKRIIIPGMLNKAVVFSTWLFPTWITAKIAGLLDKP